MWIQTNRLLQVATKTPTAITPQLALIFLRSPYPPIAQDLAESMKSSCISFPTPNTVELSRSIKVLDDFHFRVHMEPNPFQSKYIPELAMLFHFQRIPLSTMFPHGFLPPGRTVLHHLTGNNHSSVTKRPHTQHSIPCQHFQCLFVVAN